MNHVYQVFAKLGIVELFRSEKTSKITKPCCLLSTHTTGLGPSIQVLLDAQACPDPSAGPSYPVNFPHISPHSAVVGFGG